MNSINFSDLKGDGDAVELNLTGCPGHQIDDKGKAGQVTINVISKLDTGNFETIVDLELPQARTVAAALLALADYVDAADRSHVRVRAASDDGGEESAA